MALAFEVRQVLKSLNRDEKLELLQIIKQWKRFRIKELSYIGIPKEIYYEFFNWYNQKHLGGENE